MTKDLEAAYHLAAEAHPLDFFKEILRQHQESQLLELQLEEQRAQEAKERKEAKEAKAAQATPAKKSSKKAKVKTDDDLEMPDADEEEEESETTKKSNKRKADDSAEVRAILSAMQHCAAPWLILTFSLHRPLSEPSP